MTADDGSLTGIDSQHDQPTRKVYFTVASDRFSIEALTEGIGLAPDRVSSGSDRFPNQSMWEISAFGTGETDLSSMITSILARIRPTKERLAPICADNETTCTLRIIQYVGDARLGPGFGFEYEQIALLADLHAVIDVDQYWIPGPYPL